MELTKSQQQKINEIKIVFEIENDLNSDDYTIKIKTDKHSTYLTLEDPNFFYHRLYAIIGKRGKIKALLVNGMDYENYADSFISRNLSKAQEKGKYIRPKIKSKKPITYSGIEFYKTDQPPNGMSAISVSRNKTTEKFFKKYLPNTWGNIFLYAYMPNGGDGVFDIYLDNLGEDRIYFNYEPYNNISIYYVTRNPDLDGYHERTYDIDYEEDISIKLSNRQILGKIFKAYLKHNNLL